jgi:hypothetical protein
VLRKDVRTATVKLVNQLLRHCRVAWAHRIKELAHQQPLAAGRRQSDGFSLLFVASHHLKEVLRDTIHISGVTKV